ncbi:hypothetical protein [Lutibaculum baratangense]|uniref:Uncharacterized protein n=1 Tax=Lutibaculum baratangense AMV1 TaxID=631454 RepID=V4RIN7_9HYPH|nr:hypothetical protein [Lutibaculum baratangense]ESR25951.1 hypothetical protein N177_1286 [Lutibaculum baratangense AMV1]
MKTPLLAAGVLLLGMGAAHADCAEEIASFERSMPGSASAGQMADAGIAKDGSLAPLQTGDASAETTGSTGAGAATQGTAAGEVEKDGSTMPLADAQGGGDAAVAMSGQDAQAQQEGEQTAAEQAGQGGTAGESGGETVTAALDRAREASDRGDEAECMAAIEEARSLQGQQ